MIKFNSLPYRPLRITSPYGDRSEQVKGIPGATPRHDGIDIGRDRSKYPSGSGPCGPVLAVLDGRVEKTGSNSARGKYILIDHGGGVKTLYQHLHSIKVDPGDQVTAGQEIGQMGNTGVGNATHLHFELRLNGKPVDPTPSILGVPEKRKYTKKEATVKARYRFSDNTMAELLAFRQANALMDAWSMDPPRPIQTDTREWILKNVKYGAEALRRVYGR